MIRNRGAQWCSSFILISWLAPKKWMDWLCLENCLERGSTWVQGYKREYMDIILESHKLSQREDWMFLPFGSGVEKELSGNDQFKRVLASGNRSSFVLQPHPRAPRFHNRAARRLMLAYVQCQQAGRFIIFMTLKYIKIIKTIDRQIGLKPTNRTLFILIRFWNRVLESTCHKLDRTRAFSSGLHGGGEKLHPIFVVFLFFGPVRFKRKSLSVLAFNTVLTVGLWCQKCALAIPLTDIKPPLDWTPLQTMQDLWKESNHKNTSPAFLRLWLLRPFLKSRTGSSKINKSTSAADLSAVGKHELPRLRMAKDKDYRTYPESNDTSKLRAAWITRSSWRCLCCKNLLKTRRIHAVRYICLWWYLWQRRIIGIFAIYMQLYSCRWNLTNAPLGFVVNNQFWTVMALRTWHSPVAEGLESWSHLDPTMPKTKNKNLQLTSLPTHTKPWGWQHQLLTRWIMVNLFASARKMMKSEVMPWGMPWKCPNGKCHGMGCSACDVRPGLTAESAGLAGTEGNGSCVTKSCVAQSTSHA